MTTSSPVIRVHDFEVDIVRKEIKNLHLAVYPPFGRVRVAAPPQLDDDAIRLAIISRLSWVTKQRKRMLEQLRQTRRDLVDGETHYIWGRPYRLCIVEDPAPARVRVLSNRTVALHVRPGADRAARSRRLDSWYREQLDAAIPGLVSHWAAVLDVDEPTWGIRRMKTKWGTCNRERRHLSLNLELAQKEPTCLDYIVVHEMVHLLERTHTDRFYRLLTDAMPNWINRREALNRTVLAHQEWRV